MEFVVRLALQQAQDSLQGLYDGNPKRKTDRPSAEQILKAFCHITLYFLPDSTVFITPINQLQKQILFAMKMPESLYELELRTVTSCPARFKPMPKAQYGCTSPLEPTVRIVILSFRFGGVDELGTNRASYW